MFKKSVILIKKLAEYFEKNAKEIRDSYNKPKI